MNSIIARSLAVTAVSLSVSTLAGASDVTVASEALDEPILRDGKLIFPNGAAIPRYMTRTEQLYVRDNPLAALRSATDPPTGPITTPAEYEPMQGVLFSYQGTGSWKDILDAMAYHITHTGDADVFVYVPNQAGVQEVQTWMIGNAGADPDRVHIIVQPTDSIWIRDYGPRYIYEGDVRAIVDHTYNRPRPLDNAVPLHFSDYKNHAYYKIPVVHGGGNYHLDSAGFGYATRLIVNENPGLTEQSIYDLYQAYQALSTFFFNPFPTSVDSTQHIDMWMIPVSENAVIISEWPANQGSTQAIICDMAAADFASRGYTVHRIPARRLFSGGSAHYTYTNAVIVNDLVIVPSYTNSTMLQYNATAKAVWEAAMPNHTVVQVNGQPIVTAAGVFHCIMMHVPAPLGGENPTAYLRTLRGGEELEPGETVEIRWSSDDDLGVVDVDLLLSTNGGATFSEVIAQNIPDSGSHLWVVPDIATTQARLRVVVRDGDNNTGFDQSDSNFSIDGTQPSNPADLNGDGVVDVSDLLLLLGAWGACPGCDADFNGDSVVDVSDLLFLLANWG